MIKKRNSTKINYKWSDCNIIQTCIKDKKGNLQTTVDINYNNEVVCVITSVRDYADIAAYVRCMFNNGIIYPKISTFELKRIFSKSVQFTFKLKEMKVVEKVETVVEEIVNEVVDTVKTMNTIWLERTLPVVKKWIYFTNELSKFISTKERSKPLGLKDPVQNLRFNLY